MKKLSFCLLLFLASIKTFAQTKAEKIEAYLQQQYQAGKFNGNALIVDKDKHLLTKSYGYADAGKTTALTVNDRFHIGSIAKEFDAVGIMMLVEQGKVKTSDNVAQYFPELPQWAQTITIKNLLQYTSGLPDVNWKTVQSDADNWNDLKALKELKFKPGTQYDYNNNNTFMRRQLIEKISGMSFKDFVEKQLLKRAGVKNGIVDPPETTPMLAKPFDNNFKSYSLVPPITGWTCLDLDDFYQWSKAINSFRVINPASTLQISAPFQAEAQAGLGNTEMKNGKIINHTHDGIAIRYQALIQYQAAKGRTIILMTNQRQDNVYDLAGDINEIMDKE